MTTFWTARAQDGTAYNYLNIPTSSHAYALGGVNISVVDDDINLYEQNPALLGPEVDMQAGVGYMPRRRSLKSWEYIPLNAMSLTLNDPVSAPV